MSVCDYVCIANDLKLSKTNGEISSDCLLSNAFFGSLACRPDVASELWTRLTDYLRLLLELFLDSILFDGFGRTNGGWFNI